MPFKQTWYTHDHIVKVDLYGEITAAEIAQSFQVSRKFLQDSTADRVHFIHDWSGITSFPTNPLEIRRALNRPYNTKSDKLGWVVIYGVEKELLRFIGELTFQFFQIHSHMTDTLDSALEFLTQQYPTLKPFLDERSLTEVHWHIQGHVLYCRGVFTADQMFIRNLNSFQLIEREGKPPYVHMLIDYTTTDIKDYSSNLRELVRWSNSSPEFQAARDNLLKHPLFGWVVSVGGHSRNIKISGKILSSRYNYKRKEVDTLDEALTFLKQVDSNIARILQFSSDD